MHNTPAVQASIIPVVGIGSDDNSICFDRIVENNSEKVHVCRKPPISPVECEYNKPLALALQRVLVTEQQSLRSNSIIIQRLPLCQWYRSCYVAQAISV